MTIFLLKRSLSRGKMLNLGGVSVENGWEIDFSGYKNFKNYEPSLFRNSAKKMGLLSRGGGIKFVPFNSPYPHKEMKPRLFWSFSLHAEHFFKPAAYMLHM